MIQQLDKMLDDIQFILISFLVKLGPFFVALTPAIFTWWAIYSIFNKSLIGSGYSKDIAVLLAMVFGIVPALSIETIGIVVVHTAAELYDAAEEKRTTKGKFWLMVSLTPLYVIAVTLTIAFSGDAFAPVVKGLGIASPLLTVIVYTAVALARSLYRIKAKETKEENTLALKEKHDEEIRHQKALLEMEAEKERIKHQFELEKEKLELDRQYKHDLDMFKLKMKLEAKGEKTTRQDRLNNLLAIVKETPKITKTALAINLGISRPTLDMYIGELTMEGKLKLNGNGYEVLVQEEGEF